MPALASVTYRRGAGDCAEYDAPEGRGLGAARVLGQPALGLVVEILGTGAHELSFWRDRGNIGLAACYEE